MYCQRSFAFRLIRDKPPRRPMPQPQGNRTSGSCSARLVPPLPSPGCPGS